jgi:Ubiquitin family
MIGLGGNENILEVKHKIQVELGVPVDRQILSYQGQILGDGTFFYFSIGNNLSRSTLPRNTFTKPLFLVVTEMITDRDFHSPAH